MNKKNFKDILNSKDSKNRKEVKKMEEVYKKDYQALKECSEYSRAKLKGQQEDKTYRIDQEQEKRLIDLVYIDWNENSKNLFREGYILTKKGSDYYLQISKRGEKDWWKVSIIINILLAIFNIFLLGKQFSWW